MNRKFEVSSTSNSQVQANLEFGTPSYFPNQPIYPLREKKKLKPFKLQIHCGDFLWRFFMGVHSLNLQHSTTVHRILKNIPNFIKYWKMPPKIVFLKPPPNIPFQLRKPQIHHILQVSIFIDPFLIPLLYNIIKL